jgi:hypothetical protein
VHVATGCSTGSLFQVLTGSRMRRSTGVSARLTAAVWNWVGMVCWIWGIVRSHLETLTQTKKYRNCTGASAEVHIWWAYERLWTLTNANWIGWLLIFAVLVCEGRSSVIVEVCIWE